MECNKDEALRAKEIAEKKFTAKDIAGAKKFAIKAQTLFPALEGINQMISTLDVYLSSEAKVGGEKDWYSILCLSASADDETVKKQYRKLALQLHPDKNKSIGAEGAFQLISEAWNVLSDKSKRMSYDQMRNTKVFQQKIFQEKKASTVPSSSNGFYNIAANAGSKPRARRNTASATPATTAPSPHPPKSNTFWTSCNQCKMQYEYLRVYLNHNLLCPNCREPFIAAENGAPTNGTSSPMPWSATQERQQNSSHTSVSRKDTSAPGTGVTGSQKGANLGACNNSNFQWGPFSRTAGAASANASSAAAAQAANMVHQTYEEVRRKRMEAQAASKKEANRRKHSGSKRNSSVLENINLGTADSIPAKRRRGIGDDTEKVAADIRNSAPESAAGFKVISGNRCFSSCSGASEVDSATRVIVDLLKNRYSARPSNLSRESSQLDIRAKLLVKTKDTLHKKLEKWNHIKAEFEEKEKAKKKARLKQNDEKGKDVVHDVIAEDTLDDTSSNSQKDPPKCADSNSEDKEPVSIDVPDPDFHDFDNDRSESSFQSDQIWATYDEEDGMPRYYALVQKVISLTPFKIRMSYLTSKSNSEFGDLNWISSGFAKTCGDFRVGRYEVIDTLNIFSHRVRWEKGPRGVIKILPKKGDVWAFYRNWSQDWDEHTPDDVIFKYDMVEVLDDYNEEQGISVIPLVKVPGFKTVFQRHVDPKVVKKVPREEMFRFSHQVPSYLLTGEEAHNAPKGCHELDPAATPLELLQVITEVAEEHNMATDKQEKSSV